MADHVTVTVMQGDLLRPSKQCTNQCKNTSSVFEYELYQNEVGTVQQMFTQTGIKHLCVLRILITYYIKTITQSDGARADGIKTEKIVLYTLQVQCLSCREGKGEHASSETLMILTPLQAIRHFPLCPCRVM